MDQQPTASAFLAHPRLLARPMCWAVSVRRADGSADIAAELLRGALSALGADRGLATALARAVGGACRFMEEHSPERQYHLSIDITGKQSTVTCADFEDAAPSPTRARARVDERGVVSALLRDLTRAAAGVEIHDLQVRGAAGSGLLVAFQAVAPPPRQESGGPSVRADGPAEPPADAAAGAGKASGTTSGAENPGRARWEPPDKESSQRRSALLPAARMNGAPLPKAAR
ncbi:hypothetical protein AB0I49_19125 [Streptomyces sp. NPDC050617]|uniref:hypothetical protein n=1 Tax=Streptomyces sp. NPDC050617 TaxID=3154628 RepID=UPI003436EC2D